ncbi:MAG: hypothetical protein QOD94_311 [Alphaproteobacteria bacterium]|jgi:hypothetical protein|nr:hypothetical protein [Alphaproteobacteria bacterium]
MYPALLSASFLAAATLSGPAIAQSLHGTLYKDPACPCCEGHAAYLKEHGINLEVKLVDNLSEISRKAEIPGYLQGCHTIFLDGYVIERHVSMDLVEKLLSERPDDVVGITLPGMPLGVPGMEGEYAGPYEVQVISKDGTPRVFGTQ